MQHAEHCYLKSKVGWLRLSADEEGLTAIEFVDEPPVIPGNVDAPHLKEAYKQLSEYFAGERAQFNLQLNPRGTEFQRNVWKALRGIPFGTTISYRELAERVGCPKGFRAVGMANNRNPLPIVVPCHRVVGTNGDLTGYAGGLERKRHLLALEGALVQ